jgi:hypothetical protein
MRIGFYCESPADQAAMAVFAEGILGKPPDPINMDLEAHCVPAFFSALAGVFRGLHYNSDADGLVVVVDGDDTDPTIPITTTPGTVKPIAVSARLARSSRGPASSSNRGKVGQN